MCIKAAALAAAAAGPVVLATAASRFCDDSARSHVLSWAVDTRTVQHQRYVAKLPAHAKRAALNCCSACLGSLCKPSLVCPVWFWVHMSAQCWLASLFLQEIECCAPSNGYEAAFAGLHVSLCLSSWPGAFLARLGLGAMGLLQTGACSSAQCKVLSLAILVLCRILSA
jgi:hypothetical protein